MKDSKVAVEHLLYLYAERVDRGDFEGVAELLAHALITTPMFPQGIQGKPLILRMYEQSTRRYEDGSPKTKHVITNAIIDVYEDRGRATARSYYTVFQALPDFPLQAIIAGTYQDKFQRRDGLWNFVARHITVDLIGDLSHHLLIALPELDIAKI